MALAMIPCGRGNARPRLYGVEDEVFIATGAAVFHAARLAKVSEVRIYGVVHNRSHLAAGATAPIGWIAVGDPAQLLPGEHERIWEIQKPPNFPFASASCLTRVHMSRRP